MTKKIKLRKKPEMTIKTTSVRLDSPERCPKCDFPFTERYETPLKGEGKIITFKCFFCKKYYEETEQGYIEFLMDKK